MLKQLYIKNFKGFKEELIELKDVNFLVGENSTGKTSLLKLVNVLNSEDFWLSKNGSFNNNEVELGYYNEIKSQLNKDDFFRIGIEIQNVKLPNKDEPVHKHLKLILDFYNANDNPLLSKFKLSTNENLTTYGLRSKNNKYSHDYENELNVPFDKWVYSNDSQYKIKTNPFYNVNIAIWLDIIYKSIPTNKKNFELKGLAPYYSFYIQGINGSLQSEQRLNALMKVLIQLTPLKEIMCL